MKKVILPVLFMIFSAVSYTQWISNFGGYNSGDVSLTNAKGIAITVDNSGYSYVTGICNEGITGDDILIIKYDSSGDTIWTRSYNGTADSDDDGLGICVDGSGNVYVVGSATNTGMYYDMTLLKYDTNGNLQWVRTYAGTEGSNEDRALGIAVDSEDCIYITGFSTESDLKTDIVTRKYDTEGELLWSVLEDGADDLDSKGMGIVVDNSGNICVTGFTNTTNNGADIITIKYDSYGNQSSLATFNGGGNSEDKAFGIAVDENDNMYVVGYTTNSNVDYAILSYSSSGSLNWSNSYNGTGNGEDKAFGIAVDESGNSYITGYSMTSETNYDYVTLMVNSSGSIAWTSSYNGTGNGDDKASALGLIFSEGAISQVVVTGESYGTNVNNDFATVRYDASTGSQISVSRYSMSTTSNDKASDIAIIPGTNMIIVTGFSEIIIEANAGPSYLSTVSLGSVNSELITNSNTPSKFTLHQNYPNPFNPSTTIKFDITTGENVRLSVYDMLGRTVDVLINQNLQAGSYTISYTNKSLSSGIYLYELKAGNYREIKKMTLVK
jgi:hypothetical protein